jgi:hypothetical protein
VRFFVFRDDKKDCINYTCKTLLDDCVTDFDGSNQEVIDMTINLKYKIGSATTLVDVPFPRIKLK